MNKYEIVKAIMELADENSRLKQDLIISEYKSKIESSVNRPTQSVSNAKPYQDVFYKVGRDKIFDSIESGWHNDSVYISRDRSGNLSIQEYESWLKEYLEYAKIPEYMNKNEVSEEFDNELHIVYENKKESAIELFLEKEAKKNAE